MKKAGIIFGAIVLITVGLYFGTNRENAQHVRTPEERVKILLGSLHAAAQATFAEKGNFPKTFQEIGFIPAGKINATIRYKSMGTSFIASVVDKKTGYSRTMNSEHKMVDGDQLSNDPDALVFPEQ